MWYSCKRQIDESANYASTETVLSAPVEHSFDSVVEFSTIFSRDLLFQAIVLNPALDTLSNHPNWLIEDFYMNQSLIDTISEEQISSFLYNFFLALDTKDINNKLRIKKIIKSWCTMHVLQQSLSVEEFLQILHENHETRHLFDRYIKTGIGQGWYSLSSSETRKISVDFLNFFSDIPNTKQKVIMCEFLSQY